MKNSIQFQGVVLDGVDIDFVPTTTNPSGIKLNDKIIPLSFFINPGDITYGEGSYLETFYEYMMSPVVFKKNLALLNVLKGNAEANIAHTIHWTCSSELKAPIHLSVLEEEKSLRDSKEICIFYPQDGSLNAEGTLREYSGVLNYIFNESTQVALWFELSNIMEAMSLISNFTFDLNAITLPFENFAYLLKDNVVYDKTFNSEDNPSYSESYKITIEGRCPRSRNKYGINFIVLPEANKDFDLNNDYFIPSEGEGYNLLDKDSIQFNIDKGLFSLENNQMNESEFEIFFNSLIAYKEANTSSSALFSYDPSIYENNIDSTSSFFFINEATFGQAGNVVDEVVTLIPRRIFLYSNLPSDAAPVKIDNGKSIYFTIEEIPGRNKDEPTDGSEDSPGIYFTPVCLAGHTLITMADGSLKRLDEIKSGDFILSDNGQADIVLEVKRNSFNPYHILYYFENDIIIDETPEHRFYNKTQGFWQKLKNWKPGDIAIDVNGNEVRYLEKKKIYEIVENFGLYTNKGTYYANGLLSGSAKNNKAILKTASLDKGIEILGTLNNLNLSKLMRFKEV